VKRLLVIALAACAAFGVAPHRAAAAETCEIPDSGTLWVDFADGSVPFWQLFARPGVIAAASNFIYPELLRSYGAKTIYWDMHLVRRVGTPLEPFDPAYVISSANRMYDIASMSMNCSQPVIAENELNGVTLITPWSAANAQYRRNVLIYVQTLAARGARPVLLVPKAPYMGDEAGDWWREVAKYADLVRESYFSAAKMGRKDPLLSSRVLRTQFRRQIGSFTAAGIPTSKLGLMLGFHTTPGSGGREHAPLQRWLEVTKLQTLAAKEVAKELSLRSVWSWGWGVWSVGERDADKALAACVYLWARDPKLCDGPEVAGRGFNSSRTEGQLVLPRSARCTVLGRPVTFGAIRALTPVTGDENVAFTSVFARVVTSLYAPLEAKQVVAAEKAVVASRFGSLAAYQAALTRAHATPAAARGVISDELRRALIEERMKVPSPSRAAVQAYYETYAETETRLVESKKPAPWLGGHKRGFALESNAPPQLFTVPDGRWVTIQTMRGPFKVRAREPALPLGAVPFDLASSAVARALKALARDERYENWLLARERGYAEVALCRNDDQPTPGLVPLTDYLPFLAAQ
jgi:hypothetical protein